MFDFDNDFLDRETGLFWLSGAKRKWACKHVDKVPVLVRDAEGLYEWNTYLSEPKKPYQYIFLDGLYKELCESGLIKPLEKNCACKPTKETHGS